MLFWTASLQARGPEDYDNSAPLTPGGRQVGRLEALSETLVGAMKIEQIQQRQAWPNQLS